MNRFFIGLLAAALIGPVFQARSFVFNIPFPTTWAGGSGNWMNPGSWTPQPLDFVVEFGIPIPFPSWPDNTRSSALGMGCIYFVTIPSGSPRIDSDQTVGILTVAARAELRVRQGAALKSAGFTGFDGGAIYNDGLISLEQNAKVDGGLAGLLILHGAGSIWLKDSGAELSATLLRQGRQHQLRGQGRVASLGFFENRGVVLADWPGGPLSVKAGALENEGSLLATNGGWLTLEAAVFDNDGLIEVDNAVGKLEQSEGNNDRILRARNGGSFQITRSQLRNRGIIEALSGSLIDVRQDSEIAGGQLRTDSSSMIRLLEGAVTLRGAIAHDGYLQSSNAAVHLDHVVLQQTPNAVFEVLAGSPVLAGGPLVITGGSLRGPGTVTASETTTLDGSVPGAFTVSSGTLYQNGGTLTLLGSITNHGQIRAGLLTRVTPGTPVLRLEGTGELFLNSTLHASHGFPTTLVLGSTQTVFNAAGHTIRGACSLGANSLDLLNAGAIVADDPASQLWLEFFERGFTNTGQIVARGGSLLRVGTGIYHNDGGVFRAEDGSLLRYEGTPSIRGGSLQSAGSGKHYASGFGHIIRLDNTVVDGLVHADFRATLRLAQQIRTSGELRLTSAGLHLENNVTLSGPGMTRFDSQTGNGLGGTEGATLTIEDGHTVAAGNAEFGTGLFGGDGPINYVNRGRIVADGASNLSLSITLPPPRTFTNSGVVRAHSSNVRLDGAGFAGAIGGLVINDHGRLEVGDGVRFVLGQNLQVQGGVLAGSGTGEFILDGAGNTARGWAYGVTLNGRLRVPGRHTLFVGKNMVNNGELVLESGGLYALESLILAGSGVTRFDCGNNNFLSGANDAVLTIGPEQTLEVAQLGMGIPVFGGDGGIGLINEGSILAIGDDGCLTTFAWGSPRLFENRGIIRALRSDIAFSGNGVFGSRLINSNRVIEAAAETEVSFGGGVRVEGGTLATTASGRMRFTGILGNGATLAHVTLAGRGFVSGPFVDTLFFEGTLTNEGRLDLEQGRLYALGSATLAGTGLTRFGAPGAITPNNHLTGSAGATLTNAAAHTLAFGALALGAGYFGGDGDLNYVNLGTFLGDGPTGALAELVMSPERSFRNAGAIRMQTSDFNIAGGTLHNSDGLIEAGDGTTVSISGTSIQNPILLQGGTVRGAGSGQIRFINAQIHGTGPDGLRTEGNVRFGHRSFSYLAGTIHNTGNWLLEAVDLNHQSGVSFQGPGRVLFGAVSHDRQNVFRVDIYGPTALTNGPGHTFEVLTNGFGRIDAAQSAFVNAGILRVNQGGQLMIAHGNPQNTPAGRIGGSGTLTFAVDPFANAGVVAPDRSSSPLIFVGDAFNAATAVHQFEIAGTEPQAFARLEVQGRLTLGGQLRLALANAFVPPENHSWTLIRAASLNGDFASLDAPAPGPGLAWKLTTADAAVTVTAIKGVPTQTYAQWAAARGAGSPGADDDLDGLSNAAEFALGSDPKAAGGSDRPEVELIEFDGQVFLAVQFTRSLEAAGANFRLAAATDLAATAWAKTPSVLERVADLGARRERVRLRETNPIAASRGRFLRVDLELNP